MAAESEYKIPGGSLYYEKTDEGDGTRAVCVTRMQGTPGELEIPERIEDLPVRAIGRKAFLSKKSLRKVIVPAGVREVGDWAFAYCDSLRTVIFRGAEQDADMERQRQTERSGSDLRFGRAVFLECARLRFVYVDENETTAALLAAAVTVAGAPYLLDAVEAGGREWLDKWDARMMAVLRGADNEGYSKQVLCGEEDYGSTDLIAYESGQRRIKVRLLLLRLLYPAGLSEDHRQEMETYLRAHTKGCAGEETWRVVLEEYGEDSAVYRLFVELGCVTGDNLEAILSDIGGEYPEMKAYLMRCGEERAGGGDFFESLSL
ncbi:MAG: leucine-rich repeat domain-containing protein [Clostridium sp.]|nr:leucine-rich repeat domain-containing protein [Acetatifactor muris]MCM1526359.1 leucine-rich repeat domain-containing protein [Bacteroides sp.]MCM1563991.1 leucine-rich repeat domain-containing protein [Clostridium sp.]